MEFSGPLLDHVLLHCLRSTNWKSKKILFLSNNLWKCNVTYYYTYRSTPISPIAVRWDRRNKKNEIIIGISSIQMILIEPIQKIKFCYIFSFSNLFYWDEKFSQALDIANRWIASQKQWICHVDTSESPAFAHLILRKWLIPRTLHNIKFGEEFLTSHNLRIINTCTANQSRSTLLPVSAMSLKMELVKNQIIIQPTPNPSYNFFYINLVFPTSIFLYSVCYLHSIFMVVTFSFLFFFCTFY